MTFTEKDFKEAYEKALRELINDPEVEGAMRFVLPLSGSIVVSKMRKYLFNEEV